MLCWFLCTVIIMTYESFLYEWIFISTSHSLDFPAGRVGVLIMTCLIFRVIEVYITFPCDGERVCKIARRSASFACLLAARFSLLAQQNNSARNQPFTLASNSLTWLPSYRYSLVQQLRYNYKGMVQWPTYKWYSFRVQGASQNKINVETEMLFVLEDRFFLKMKLINVDTFIIRRELII